MGLKCVLGGNEFFLLHRYLDGCLCFAFWEQCAYRRLALLSAFARYGNGVAYFGRVTLHMQCALHGAVSISIMTVLITRNIFE